jgi:hypothetical protein
MILPIEARKLAIAAQARDVPLIASYLAHCKDRPDAARSIEMLKTNLAPDQFLRKSPVKAPARRAPDLGRAFGAKRRRVANQPAAHIKQPESIMEVRR